MLAVIKHVVDDNIIRESTAVLNELQVNKIDEIKQRLVELWQSSSTTFEWKRLDFRVSVFSQVVQKHYLGELEK